MTVSTHHPSMRDRIFGWSFEDGNKVRHAFCERIGKEDEYMFFTDVPISKVRSGVTDNPSYSTILHALADNWKLLAPPTRYTQMENRKKVDCYEWWLVKD